MAAIAPKTITTAVVLTISEALFFQGTGVEEDRENAWSLTTVVLPAFYDYKVVELRR